MSRLMTAYDSLQTHFDSALSLLKNIALRSSFTGTMKVSRSCRPGSAEYIVERGALHGHAAHGNAPVASEVHQPADQHGPALRRDDGYTFAFDDADHAGKFCEGVLPIRRRIIEFGFHNVRFRNVVFQFCSANRAQPIAQIHDRNAIAKFIRFVQR